MERKIINENKSLQDAAINDIKDFTVLLNKSLATLKGETAGFVLSMPEVVTLMDRSDTNQVSIVNERLNKFFEKEMRSLKIVAPIIKKNLKNGYAETLKIFIIESRELADLPGSKYLDRLTMVNDAVILSEDEEQAIRESFMNTLESEAAIQLWQLQKDTGERLTELYTMMEKCRINYGSLGAMVNDLFKVDSEKGNVHATELQYETIAKRR